MMVHLGEIKVFVRHVAKLRHQIIYAYAVPFEIFQGGAQANLVDWGPPYVAGEDAGEGIFVSGSITSIEEGRKGLPVPGGPRRLVTNKKAASTINGGRLIKRKRDRRCVLAGFAVSQHGLPRRLDY